LIKVYYSFLLQQRSFVAAVPVHQGDMYGLVNSKNSKRVSNKSRQEQHWRSFYSTLFVISHLFSLHLSTLSFFESFYVNDLNFLDLPSCLVRLNIELDQLRVSIADITIQVVLPDMIDILPSSLIKDVFIKLVWYSFTFEIRRESLSNLVHQADKMML